MKTMKKEFLLLESKKSMCLFLSFSMSVLRCKHHPAPVAQSDRASYLLAMLA